MATGGRLGSLPVRRAKILPSRSISTLQPAACAQSTNRSRICLSSTDSASQRWPRSRKRPISAERSRLSHRRSGLTSRTLPTTRGLLLYAAFYQKACQPRSMLEVDLLRRRCCLEVHPPLVDRPPARGRAGILDEQDGAAGLGPHLVLEMRVFHVDQRARTVFPLAHLELAVDDVPDLREVVLVEGKPRAGFVAQEAGIGHGRALRRRMEEELGDVVEAADLPVHLAGMPELRRVVDRVGRSLGFCRHGFLLPSAIEVLHLRSGRQKPTRS